MRTRLVAVSISLAACSWAQQQRLSVKPPEQVVVNRGARVTQTLQVTVQPGFHVNSNDPKGEYLIPLRLTWAEGPLKVERVEYPRSEQINVGSQNLAVFTGQFVIRTEFQGDEHAPPGPSSLNGKLHYQACNNQMCFRPTSLDVQVPVLVR